MAPKKTKGEPLAMAIEEIQMVQARFFVLGRTPMIMNKFAQKAWQELLLPSKRKNTVEREQSLKHDPEKEFRGALYRAREVEKRKALFYIPSSMFHQSIAAAALDMPGATRSKIERLTRIKEIEVELFGVPKLHMAMVRNSDMNRTPDVRTRPIFEQWACSVTVQFVKDLLTERTIGNLFGAAGQIVGVGDWRGQKGGSFGAFDLVSADDAEWLSIVKLQGKGPQQKAFDHPACFDPDSEELLRWFNEEIARRETDKQHGDLVPARAARGKVVNGETGAPLDA